MKQYCIALIASLCVQQHAVSGVTITGTRVVFPSDQKQVVVQLNNPDQRAALVQSWLDDGDPKEIPSAERMPFILTPPLVRIEANKGQMIRLFAKNVDQLPKDRESLYWFNILDVAPTDQSVINKLNISVRSRIKLFYRPIQLIGKPEHFFQKLHFKYNAETQSIKVTNPSPYYMSFQQVVIQSKKGMDQEIYTSPLMVGPLGEQTFKTKVPSPSAITYTLINDFGGTESFNTIAD
ncbi:fimbrial biogenesis chaperone [Acinetobacter boissieri]|uniref:Fimbrial chaperone protein n=1 Tax=Acinetobacter boissieri TaxID=1219383 RepID=A0A1G6ITV5_9GAMM|nr:molecular chaperone [Acinetobacter boissieri]SDC10012.1 fimbrial chaperone protein [Acinetobacter boissieri]